ncbi:MAG: sulfotransferase [Flavobacteriales bacterium]|nr:sulfotransferase [Flavobacteriales bacterium]
MGQAKEQPAGATAPTVRIDLGPRVYWNLRSHAAFGSSSRNWFSVLWRNGRGISFRFVPRIIVITLTVVASAPARLIERLRFGKRIRNTTVQDPIFILGHPRSGTTYLHYILSRDPRFAFCAVYESLMPWVFLSFGRPLRAILRRALPATRPMDNLRMGAELPKEEEFALACMGPGSMVTGYFFPRKMAAMLDRYVLLHDAADKRQWQAHLLHLVRKLTLKYGPRPLLLKSPWNTARVKEILEVFPNARFIHIHRDPYTVYASNLRLYEKTLPMLTLQTYSAADVEDFVLHGYKVMMEKFHREKALIPSGHLVEFSYEEFIGKEIDMLERVYAQLGLPDFEHARPLLKNEIAAHEEYVTNEYHLDPATRARIQREWGDVMDRSVANTPVRA